MLRADVRAIGDLAGEALGHGGGLIREMHDGIAGRPFGVLGPAAGPVRVVHDAVAGAVYGGVRAGLRAAGRGAGLVASLSMEDAGPSLAERARGAFALGALNGFYGDHLAARDDELAVDMSFPDLERGRAHATSRLAVFVHGLCGTDEVWRVLPLRSDRAARRSYGERLQDELSFTPLHLRYNTGLRVSDNGRALARLLDDVVRAWPVPVEEVVLVGHSMGGLVARSACHYGEAGDLPWVDAVRHVFCLGTPHLGADLEKGVNVMSWALGRLPETRALATFLNARSVGIKDMRFGNCVEEDWCDCEPDEFLRDRCREVPFLPHAHYYFVGVTMKPAAVGALVGDLLVRMPSASGAGRSRRIPFEVDNGLRLDGLTHFDLLNHPAVYEQLRTWITRSPSRRALPAPSGARRTASR